MKKKKKIEMGKCSRCGKPVKEKSTKQWRMVCNSCMTTVLEGVGVDALRGKNES